MSETIRLFTLQICLIAVVLIMHTYIGLHIIRRILIFSDLVLDQLAAFGALVGVALYLDYTSPLSYLIAFAMVLIGSVLLAWIKPRRPAIPREAVIGILYAMALVICLLLTDKMPGGEGLITTTLSGCLLWVTWPLVLTTVVVYGILLVIHYVYRRRFIALTENPGSLHRERLWDFLFFTSQGVITVLIVPIAGVLLAYSFLMIPAAIATLFTKRWGSAMLLGWTIGFLACCAGLGTSYAFNFPYGPTLVLSLGVCFLVSLVLRAIIGQKTAATVKGTSQ
jgi:zinc/manganese transport system permease protein